VGYHIYLRHGISVCWSIKTRLESGPVTADLTTTLVHSSKLLINDVKPDHSLTLLLYIIIPNNLVCKIDHIQILVGPLTFAMQEYTAV